MTDIDLKAAFPHVSHGGIHEHQLYSPGLTKREYFSIMALQGIAANMNYTPQLTTIKSDVETAISYADELLEQLGGKNETD